MKGLSQWRRVFLTSARDQEIAWETSLLCWPDSKVRVEGVLIGQKPSTGFD